MIVTIILIGIVVSIGGILATTTTDIVTTGLVLDAVEIKRLSIQNTGTTSYITGMIKNSGNTDVTDAMVIVTLGNVTGDADGIFVKKFRPDTINSGVTATVNAQIVIGSDDATGGGSAVVTESAAGTPHRLTIGEKYLVEVRANVAGGGEYSQTKIISPQ